MAKSKTSPEELLTSEQAGVELGIGVTRVLVLVREGRLRAIRHGWAWIIRRGDLDLVRDCPPGRSRSSTPVEPATPRPGSRKKTTRKKQDS